MAHLVAQFPRFFTFYNGVFLLEALLRTLGLTGIGCGVGLVLGFAIAVFRRTRTLVLAPIRALCILFVELFRRVPFLVTLLLVFYASQALGFELSLLAIASISVCLIATAYISEIVRAGLDSVHPNQWDSAAVCNFSLAQTLWLVVVPQAWRVILPPAFAFFLLLLKDSALASQIGVVELTYAGKVLNNRGFAPALSFGTILLLYFVLSYPLTRIGQRMEAHLSRSPHR
jgi:polar amino acid transport system permease protein